MNKVLAVVCCLSAISLVGCATSQKVKTVEIGDHKLTCNEIVTETKKLDVAEADVDDKKGVTGANVAAALFWLPGLAYTYYDAGQAGMPFMKGALI